MAQEDQGATASAATNPFTDKFGKYVNELLKRHNAPSVALAVIDGDEIFTQVRQWDMSHSEATAV